MNTCLRLAVTVLLLSLLADCKQRGEKYAGGEKIAVQWELTTNFTDEENVFDAQFTLTNNSDLALTDANWKLFFNMAPRPILENKQLQPARIQHINGDWYRMVPEKGFALPPGHTVVIRYRGTEGVIKETDRPLGLYFVFYDEQGAAEKIVEVNNYTWTPFTRPDQINRGPQDEEPIPTAAWRYENNHGLTDVSEAQWRRIVPLPAKVRAGKGTFAVDASLPVYYSEDLAGEARYLAKCLQDVTGTSFNTTTERPSGKHIALRKESVTVHGVSKEAYRLRVTDSGIDIAGTDAAGVFYGIQSLRALLPVAAYKTPTTTVALQHTQVEDAPRFGFRGLHLDVARNFQTKETIFRTLDLLALYKINRFLLYMTEDEGWRLEIEGLPELTGVSAHRAHTTGKEKAALHPAYGSGPFAKAAGTYGHGYYTRQDFIDILRYAAARHIKVIPEVNFPGHARAAIKAMEARYERLMKEGKEAEANEYRLIDPDDKSVYLSAQGYTDNIVCVARASVYHFYEKVVDEIAAMYQEAGLTLDEFHTGGDEVPEGAWTRSPMAAALLKDNPTIGDPKNLQTYFLRRLVPLLKKRKLQIDGWEEVALVKTPDGKYIPNNEFVNDGVVPYIWNNLFDPDLGYRLANGGYDVVLCNVSNFYFDLAYDKDPGEPGLYWAGFVDTRNAWTFAPYDMFKTTNKNAMGQPLDLEAASRGQGGQLMVEKLKPSARHHIVGLEAQIWSETIKGQDMMEYYMLPKLIGFAESAWSPERKWETVDDRAQREAMILAGWNVFANTLARQELPRLHYLNGGYNYRVPPPGAVVVEGELKANTAYPGLVIRYTTDGTEPAEHSPAYTGPVAVRGAVKLKSFDPAGKASKTVTVTLE